MTHGNEHDAVVSLSPVAKATMSRNKENGASLHASALSPSHKHMGDRPQADYDGDDDHHPLADLINLRIDESERDVEKSDQTKEEEKPGKQRDGRHEDSDEVFFTEHNAVFEYFYENVPVARELQELRHKVRHSATP